MSAHWVGRQPTSMKTFGPGKTKPQFDNLATLCGKKKRDTKEEETQPISMWPWHQPPCFHSREKAAVHMCIHTLMHARMHARTIKCALIMCPAQTAVKAVRPERTTVSRQLCLSCDRYKLVWNTFWTYLTPLWWTVLCSIYTAELVVRLNKLHAQRGCQPLDAMLAVAFFGPWPSARAHLHINVIYSPCSVAETQELCPFTLLSLEVTLSYVSVEWWSSWGTV